MCNAAVALFIEHQLLRADASLREVERACVEARKHGFHSVCVHGSRLIQAAALLEESEVKLVTVVGFPLGAMETEAKRYETEAAIDNGAQEISVVINIGWLKDGADSAVLRELRDVVEAADERPVGVVLETPLLTPEEKVRACRLAAESGAVSVITCTGFGPSGALLEDIGILRGSVEATFGVTAAGAIRDARTVLALLEAGATRIATAEGVAIVSQGLA